MGDAENDETLGVETASETKAQQEAVMANETTPGQELDKVKDQLLRLQAEFENYRKRSELGMKKSREIGKIELALGLLTFVDEFEVALSHLKGEDAQGFTALQANLSKMLESQGIRKMDCMGKEYDSNLHDVLKAEEGNEKQGTIVKIIKDGYTCSSEVVRHALVIVSSGSKAENGENAQKTTKGEENG